MKNLLTEDRSVREACDEVLRGSYPMVAKQLAKQLIEALEESVQREGAIQSLQTMLDAERSARKEVEARLADAVADLRDREIATA